MHDPRRCLREHVRDLLRVSTDATAHLDHLDLAMPNGFTHSVELDVHMPSPAARLVVAVVDCAFVVHMDRRRLADVDAELIQERTHVSDFCHALCQSEALGFTSRLSHRALQP